jgi:hypothetical protein
MNQCIIPRPDLDQGIYIYIFLTTSFKEKELILTQVNVLDLNPRLGPDDF